VERSLVAAVVQLSSQADLRSNLSACEERMREAVGQGAELILLPENFAYFGVDDARADVAEDLERGGPIVDWLRRAAVEHGVAVVGGGFPERSGDPRRPYNTCVVVEKGGQIAARYRKVHLFDVELPDGARFAESATTTPGAEVVVVPLAGTRVGISICYDLRFPELYRRQVRAGAEVVLVPAAFTERTGRDHWHVLLRSRAIENQVWVLAANQWGSHPGGRRCYGHSLVVDPWGRVAVEVARDVGVATTRIDLELVAETRRKLPCLEHAKLRP
jgi:predicted amidohydrolase